MTTPMSIRKEAQMLDRVAQSAANVKKRDIVVNHDDKTVTLSIQDFSDLVMSLKQSRQDNLDLLEVIAGRDAIMLDCVSEAQGVNVGRAQALADVCAFLMRSWNNIAEQRKNSMFYPFAEGMEVALDLIYAIVNHIEGGEGLDQVFSAFRDYDNDEDAENEYYFWFASHPTSAATGADQAGATTEGVVGPADSTVPPAGA